MVDTTEAEKMMMASLQQDRNLTSEVNEETTEETVVIEVKITAVKTMVSLEKVKDVAVVAEEVLTEVMIDQKLHPKTVVTTTKLLKAQRSEIPVFF